MQQSGRRDNGVVSFAPCGCVLLALLWFIAGTAAVAAPVSLTQLRTLRDEAKNRQRRLIYNNDGDDVKLGWDGPATREKLLSIRTAPLAGTQVDSYWYSTGGISFDQFRHKTEKGIVFERRNHWPHNKIAEFIDQGTDALHIMVDFCRENNMEVFWSYRMNDTHDAGYYKRRVSQGRDPILISPWKLDHPEYLVGSLEKEPPYGRWSSVDYSHQAVRGRAFSLIEEVCAKYDVDGIELDFFRHPCFFKSVAWGDRAGPDERAAMTSLMQRIREMTETVGMQRGKPILVAIRVPDSVPFCRAIGLDLEAWLRQGLVDLMVTTGYFRLNPWQYSVALGHKYGAKVYACLSEVRPSSDAPQYNSQYRNSPQGYRARAMRAWDAGVDGMYLFNWWSKRKTDSPLLNELGSLDTLRTKDKAYLKMYRNLERMSVWVTDAATFANRNDLLGPGHGRSVAPGASTTIALEINDPVDAIRADSQCTMRATLRLWVEKAAAVNQLSVALAGRKLQVASEVYPSWRLYWNENAKWKKRRREQLGEKGFASTDGWYEFTVPPTLLEPGENAFVIAVAEEAPVPVKIGDLVLWLDYQEDR